MAANHEFDGDARAELDWLAFQYVSGELSTVEADEFETRLLDDPAAGEAVSRAVALAEAVRRSGSVPISTGSVPAVRVSLDATPAGRHLSVLTVAGVIAAALLISFRSDDGQTNVSQVAPVTPEVDLSQSDGQPLSADAQLVASWTEARDTIAALDSELLADSLAAELLDTRVDAASDVPDWLFVAVELSQQSADGVPQSKILEN